MDTKLNRRRFVTISVGLAAASALGDRGFADDLPLRQPTRHPNLLLNDEELEQIRRNIEQERWARNLYDRLRRQAEDTIQGNASELGSDFAWFYDEGHLRWKDAEKDTWKFKLWTFGRRMRDVALVSAIEGGVPEYVAKVRDFLLRIPDMRDPKAVQKHILFTHHMGGCNCCWAFDLIHGQLGEDDRRSIEDYFRAWGHESMNLLPHARKWNANIHFWVTGHAGMVGYLLGDQQLIDFAEKEFKSFVGTYPNREGIVYELKYVSSAATMLAEAAFHYGGSDLWNWESPEGYGLKQMFEDYKNLTFPHDFRVSNWGDYGTGPKWLQAIEMNTDHMVGDWYMIGDEDGRDWNKLDLVYRRFQDPSDAWFLSQNPLRDAWDHPFWGYTAMSHGNPLPEDIEAPPAPSSILAHRKVVMLRADQSPSYWKSTSPAVSLRYGGRIGHGHHDSFHITLHGAGTLLEPDWFAGQYHGIRWSGATIGHNTVTINNRSASKQLKVTEHEFGPAAQMVRVEGDPYEGVKQSRTLVLTKDYLLDVFNNRSQGPQQYDWAVRSFGQQTFPGLDLEAFDAGTALGFAGLIYKSEGDVPRNYWLRHGAHLMTDQQLQARWVQQDGRGLEILMLGESNTELIRADAHYSFSKWNVKPPIAGIERHPENGFHNVPAPDMPWDLPMMVVRRRGKATTYVALHRPFLDGDAEQTFEFSRLFEEKGVALFRVKSESFTDLMLYATSLGEHQVKVPGVGRFAFTGGYGYLRITKDGVNRQGNFTQVQFAEDRGPL